MDSYSLKSVLDLPDPFRSTFSFRGCISNSDWRLMLYIPHSNMQELKESVTDYVKLWFSSINQNIMIHQALKGLKREDVQLATKFGIQFKGGFENTEVRGDPEYVRACCEASLKRLDVDYIDLYYVHRIDTRVPIEITMGELKKLVEEGKIKYIGLSEAGPETIRRAHAVHPITAVELERSLWTRDAEDEVIPTCRELGIGIVPFAPLGTGFFASGVKLMDNIAANDYRQILPRVQGENFDHNKAIIERISEMAQRKGCTLAQLALAWVLHQGDDVGPIPGTTKIENLNQNLGALGVTLTVEDMAELDMNSFWIVMILWFTPIFRREYALMQVTIQVAAELLNVHPSYDMN